MQKKNNGSSRKNRQVILVAALAVVLAGLIVSLVVLGQGSGEKPQATPAATTLGDTTTPVQTTPEETTHSQNLTTPFTTPPQRADGSYEQWLAAAGVFGVTMEYPEFQLLGIYAPGQTPLEERQSSAGVYIHILFEDQPLLIHCAPLTAERSAKGTTDIYTSELGYNTFDLVDASAVALDTMPQLQMQELEVYFEQTILPALYSR